MSTLGLSAPAGVSQLKLSVKEMESHLASAQERYDALREQWEKLAAIVSPVEEKMREIEALMDQIKPYLSRHSTVLDLLRQAAS